MTVACLGWGSLVWDPRELPLAGEWSKDGPELPLEFARESADGRMTLVVLDDGPTFPTLWAPLDVPDVDRAMQALQRREGVPWYGSIGRWPRRSTIHRHADVAEAWAKARGFSGVVWTDLKPGMKEDRDRGRYDVPSLDRIAAHLAQLRTEALEAAARYIRSAPLQIATPYRPALELLVGKTLG